MIVATYNRLDTLPDCLRSILDQSYPDIEIIVVNDAGKDVDGIITSLNRKNTITYVKHPANRGIAAARNTGISLAKGKYLAYLDDDDRYYPDHVETLVGVLDGGGHKVAYTDAYRAHRKTGEGQDIVRRRDIPYSLDFDAERILVRNFIPTLCVMHEKSCLDDTGLFDETLPVLEDWDLWIRLSGKYAFRHIPKITCEFSWKTDGGTLTRNKQALFWKTVEVIYSKHHDLANGKPRVQKARRHYLRNVKLMAFLSRLLGERSALFRFILDTLTDAYNRRSRFP